MSDYNYPIKDAEFIINDLIGLERIVGQAGLEEVNSELVSAILEEAARLGTEVISPLNVVGDREGATLDETGVRETPGFADAYRQYIENGWSALPFDEEYGGQGMPKILGTAAEEIWQSANLAFSLCPLLTHGAIDAIEKHATEDLKQAYLPKLISGEWTGTMNLTEPQAGSDLAAITTKAVPEGDHYRIIGQKIYITWGDHQMTDNVIHLVLARLPDAPQGVRGISLFLVPKFLLDENGKAGGRNDVQCVSLEHKLGIHGSPTCVMMFGDKGGAEGYLVGEPHRGLMAMFTMMNAARQSVGLQGLSASSRSYQQALAYAKDRLQGTRGDGSRFPIIDFPDVRRMLMLMKSGTEAMRAFAYVAAAEIDRGKLVSEPEQAAAHHARVELFTPIVKGWLTEMSQELTSYGIQIHGGMGYVEETGSAQYYRDARITTIYEGTTGIQANDLMGRKTLADNGEVLADLLREIQDVAESLVAAGAKLADIGNALQRSVAAALDTSQWILDNARNSRDVAGGAGVNFLMLLGYVCGGWVMGQSALKASEKLGKGAGDAAFLKAKLITAQFYAEHFLPRAGACMEAVKAGPESMMDMPVEQF
ncbi:MAG: acyl-CoA dehydrogenase [Xanthomonadales bacterium]|nr:acyl-CoA dehydrogenase [Gammaproteobacteria bacterium]MBT8053917.1 acyl-CoA dehydrogenase [Gammaproteobacteria bacterium]NND58258.1 acyl-CoA dehydrogenase [Xanthomonadales bacterium]NNK52031.1 acyl-CoA dehydrogenase [Xanthomonadales bacterium]